MSAKVMVIGSGGREHALAKALMDGGYVEEVSCCPGNGGTEAMEGVRNVNLKDHQQIKEFADNEDIDLTIVGPEAPLAEGLADLFYENDLPIFGFKKKTAKLESSKVWAKEFMKEYGIPTADFEIFTSYKHAVKYLKESFRKKDSQQEFYIKADELCGGKGAIHASTFNEGKAALKSLLLDKKCGQGEKVVIEDKLEGEEATILAFLDVSGNYKLMPPMQDHKPVYTGDKGPNTGGMGAYAPAPVVTEKRELQIRKRIIGPTIEGMKKEGLLDNGILYFGLLISKTGDPYLLEYNVRFGDPEAQPVLPLLDTDLYSILINCIEGKLDQIDIRWKNKAGVCVVLATSGYPIDYGDEKEEITGIEEAESLGDVIVYHAGTKLRNGKFYTSGGRILGITAIGATIEESYQKAYQAVKEVHFNGMHFREDIAAKALK